MLLQFHTDELAGKSLPLAFWEIDDDNIFYDALQYLPCCMFTCGGISGAGHDEHALRQLPAGFRIALAVFELEDGFANEGWTAIGNMGIDRLLEVLSAYRTIGLDDRAAALSRVIDTFVAAADDDEALARAAGGRLPDLIDDDPASARVVAWFRDEPDRKFGVLPAEG